MDSPDWGTLYIASEWAVRIGALFYVPQRRTPNASRAWLLLIFFWPWVGLLLYFLIGRAYIPKHRFELQRYIYQLIRHPEQQLVEFNAGMAHVAAPELLPALRLADQLSEFPLIGGNSFELLPDYSQAIDRIITDIDSAQRYAHLLFYIFENDEVGRQVADALLRAARRGVVVRVLMDAVGSRAGLKGLGPELRAAGVEVIAAQPLSLWGPNAARFDLRNHRKIVVIDDSSAFFGSQNIVSPHANKGMVNEELLVRATGAIVQHLGAVLLGDRYIETGNFPPEAERHLVPPAVTESAGIALVVPSGPGYSKGTAEAVMTALMYGARSRVVLTSPYVIPTESFFLALCSTARRGVTVDLIVDQESNKLLAQLAQQSYYDGLLKAGVNIHRHTGSFLHAKHISIDSEVALIGSSNLDIRSFDLNAEVSVLICDRTVVEALARMQAGYLANTNAVTLEERRNLPVRQRVLENVARLMDSLL